MQTSLKEIQPILDTVNKIAQEILGEPYTIEINIWNDGTFQVTAFQMTLKDGKSLMRRVISSSGHGPDIDSYRYQELGNEPPVEKEIERTI
jgi:hypothetical protein